MLSDEEINKCLEEAKVPELPEQCQELELLIARAIESKVREATLEEAAKCCKPVAGIKYSPNTLSAMNGCEARINALKNGEAV